jgi:hypothetical protein
MRATFTSSSGRCDPSRGEFMSQRLVSLVAAVDELPTLEQVDSMLVELGQMPRDRSVTGLIDNLLDYRAALAA